VAVERVQRILDEVVGELIAPLLHAAPGRATWRLVSWDAELGICVTVAKGDSWLLVELERRDEARPCYARTSLFNVCARRQTHPELPLTGEERRVVDQLIELVRRRESALPLLPRPAPVRGSEVREIVVDRMLMPERPGQYYLNPYVGCMIGCEFCYVAGRADLSRSLEGLPELPWGRYVDVKVNAGEVVRREVKTLTPGAVRISPILTDPYQPIERKYRVTRQSIEAMAGTGFAPAVLTRAARIHDDLELIASIPRTAIGISIPTDDDSIRRQFEPGGDSIEDRLAVLEAFHRAGVATVAVVQPLLPMNPERLAEKLAPFARLVRIDRMYELPRARHLYAAAGRLDAMEDSFFEETGNALRAALRARGVKLDGLDVLGAIFE
jgi:DNA repair photolyase